MDTSVSVPVRAGKKERDQMVEAYHQYLVKTDGEPGADGTTLALREQGMERLRSQRVSYRGPVTDERFLAEYHRRAPGADTPKELLLLLAFVKINSQEAFA